MHIAIIDDHKLLTDAIEVAIDSMSKGYKLTVFNQPQLFIESLARKIPIDLVITDLLMPQMSGIDLIQAIRAGRGNEIKVIVLTSVNDAQTIRHAMRVGANGYISKDSALAELHDAIDEITNGRDFISKSLQKNLIKSMFIEDQYVLHLSPREKEVLTLVCSGRTIKEMAYDLGLSAHTVQTYQKNIMKKFKVNRTADLIVFAIQNGLYHVLPK